MQSLATLCKKIWCMNGPTEKLQITSLLLSVETT